MNHSTVETGVKTKPTIYLVGDSTVSKHENSKRYYPCYGYGTQLFRYITDAEVCNLALGGRSSKSFSGEENYRILLDNLRPGDYLIIAFGHNDQKKYDSGRFTVGSGDYTDETSFGYHLYQNYIKIAKEKGALPILCTPIVRAADNNDYSGATGHITPHGDYPQAIRDLAKTFDVPVVDLTAITKSLYVSIGFEEARWFHSVERGKYEDIGGTVVPDMESLDRSHLNEYGARYIAWLLACELKHVECICEYIQENPEEPAKDMLLPCPGYEMPQLSV